MMPLGAIAAAVVALLALAAWMGYRVYQRFPVHLIYRSKQQLQATFDSINDPLAIIDSSYTLLRVNRAYASLVNRRFPEILGRKCFQLLRNRPTPCPDCRMTEVLTNGSPATVERTVHPAAPSSGIISLSFDPYRSSGDGVGGVVERIRDITTLERLKTELEQQNAALTATTGRLEEEQARTREELELARQIQLGIMPRQIPTVKGLRITATYQPVEEVGGDLYDFIPFSEDSLGIFIGDASGHGLASAFVATISKMMLYSHTKEVLPPSDLLQKMNDDLIRNIHSGHYLTCFWGIIDLTSGTLTYARAGHPGPILIGKAHQVSILKSAGTFVGILESPRYEERSVTLQTGDRLYLFTDGIYEVMGQAADPTETILGYKQFQDILIACNRLPFEQIVPAIKQRLARFSYEDDYTLIVIEVNGFDTKAV